MWNQEPVSYDLGRVEPGSLPELPHNAILSVWDARAAQFLTSGLQELPFPKKDSEIKQDYMFGSKAVNPA